MIKAIIFDMDGVLIDSQPLHYEIDIAVLKRAGYSAALETVTPYTGMSNPDRWPKYRETLGFEASGEQLIHWANEIMMEMFTREELTPIKGIPELLRGLKEKGLPLAVASSSSHELIDLILDKLHIADYFNVLVSGEDVTVGKPAPDVFLFAAEKLGYKPEECVVVEDSPNGIRAAKNAGMVCVAYNNPTTVCDSGVYSLADYVIKRYEDFPQDIYSSDSKLFIVEDVKGNKLLDITYGDENTLISCEEYRPLTSSLVIIKSSKGFMLLKNKFRNEWEIAGGMIDDGETPRDCAIRECCEESGYVINNPQFIGVLKFFLRPSFHWNEERIEYSALYCAYVEHVQDFMPNNEMLDLCWYTIGGSIKNASKIDLKLLEYYRGE